MVMPSAVAYMYCVAPPRGERGLKSFNVNPFGAVQKSLPLVGSVD